MEERFNDAKRPLPSSNNRRSSVDWKDNGTNERAPLLGRSPASDSVDEFGATKSTNGLKTGFTSNNKEVNGDHCHGRSASATNDVYSVADKDARRKLIIASIICVCFMLGEIVGGLLSNSLAIATDAAHLLTDLAGFLISLFSVYIASRPATTRMSFGYYRAEVMGALLSVLLIWIVTGILVVIAVQRVISLQFEINAKLMLIMAALSVVFNLIMGVVLFNHPHGHGHGHSHGHSHGPSLVSKQKKRNSHQQIARYTDNGSVVVDGVSADHHHDDSSAKEETNINLRAAFIHIIGDLLQSIGVLTAAYVIYFKPEWKIVDPICTFVFSFLVLCTTITILRDVLAVLMEATPRNLSFAEIREALCSIEGVRELHDLRLWSLTTNKAALAVHLAIDKEADTQRLLAMAGSIMGEKFAISECTFQMEYYVDEMDSCVKCRGPQD